ncbi:hypothetical protein NJ76_23895 [Rhodococcus sp. IITR03]|nr:hypothetical protein NJ76_23895 [Rhodococcus sp. IITR03]
MGGELVIDLLHCADRPPGRRRQIVEKFGTCFCGKAAAEINTFEALAGCADDPNYIRGWPSYAVTAFTHDELPIGVTVSDEVEYCRLHRTSKGRQVVPLNGARCNKDVAVGGAQRFQVRGLPFRMRKIVFAAVPHQDCCHGISVAELRT